MSTEVSTLLRKRRILSAPCHRGRHMLQLYKATGKWRPSSLRPGGMEPIPTAREKMVAGWRWILAKSLFIFIFLSFLLSSFLLGYCSYLSDTTVSLLVRLTPFSGGALKETCGVPHPAEVPARSNGNPTGCGALEG